ncbi:hypothetical protein BDV25DRAFT_170776 [Aspergillus avenaceus]|uniref:Aminoglycoside phosphotransferase domain-containing protein n=1 Tax=Aspergillus avenaceus TaxID=36643 RepID=A0A5N6U0I4_ASPAV|nr:hypothetical protein BDV25DRAFT_170776 [Aspergillus avenaceus]
MTTVKRRRLLRGKITYSAAKEHETNILHALGYWDQQSQYFKDLHQKRHLIEALVAHHLNLGMKTCHIGEPAEWLSGTFNVCIPVFVNHSQRPGFLVRLPLPYRVGEAFNPGNADEKIACEVGTYVWLQRHCPEVPIPRLHGYGFSTGQTFTALENLPLLTRTVNLIHRRLLRLLGYELPSTYVAHKQRQNTLGVGYLLIEYIDQTRGRMLSESWHTGRHDTQLRTNLFHSLSSIVLSLSRTPIQEIGSFIINEQGFLRLKNRPLTLEIQDLENHRIPVDIPRESTYSTVDAYINDILAFHESRFRHQPNALNDIQDGLFQIAALTVMRTVRQAFFRPELRRGPFFLALTDLHQSNILVDDDWNIACLVDLEWACSRPAEMIHPPYWLTSQAVDGIDAAEYEKLHEEFMQAFVEREAVYPQTKLRLSRIMQDGWMRGTFWYALALDSPTGLFRIFYDHIQPRFCRGHVDDAAFFRIVVDYWEVGAFKFVLRKVDDKERYDRLLRDAFSLGSW